MMEDNFMSTHTTMTYIIWHNTFTCISMKIMTDSIFMTGILLEWYASKPHRHA